MITDSSDTQRIIRGYIKNFYYIKLEGLKV